MMYWTISYLSGGRKNPSSEYNCGNLFCLKLLLYLLHSALSAFNITTKILGIISTQLGFTYNEK